MQIYMEDWKTWSKHVLLELERLNENQDSLKHEMSSIKVEIATLKVKSGMWGVAGAMIPVTLMIIMNFLS